MADHPITKLDELLPHRWALAILRPPLGLTYLHGELIPLMVFAQGTRAAAGKGLTKQTGCPESSSVPSITSLEAGHCWSRPPDTQGA